MSTSAPSTTPRRLLASVAFAALLAIQPTAHAQGGATVTTEPSAAQSVLAGYDRFELAQVALASGLRGAEVHESARSELQAQFANRLAPWLATRNAAPARAKPARLLRIEPVIERLARVDPAVRLAVGAAAIPEQWTVRIRFVDAAGGEVVAELRLRAVSSPLTSVSSPGASAPLPRAIADALVEFLDDTLTQARATARRAAH